MDESFLIDYEQNEKKMKQWYWIFFNFYVYNIFNYNIFLCQPLDFDMNIWFVHSLFESFFISAMFLIKNNYKKFVWNWYTSYTKHVWQLIIFFKYYSSINLKKTVILFKMNFGHDDGMNFAFCLFRKWQLKLYFFCVILAWLWYNKWCLLTWNMYEKCA